MASSVQYRIIDLQHSILSPSWLRFLRAEVPIGPYMSPFVVIRYSQYGVEQMKGLRLDLDKGVFLDHFADPEQESFLRSKASEVVATISAVLRDQLLADLPTVSDVSQLRSPARGGSRQAAEARTQHIFICFEGDTDAHWASLFQAHLDENLTETAGNWNVTLMDMGFKLGEMPGLGVRYQRAIASSRAIIVLLNDELFTESAPSTELQTWLKDARADGVEVVPVLTSHHRRSLLHKAKVMFHTRPYILEENEPQTLDRISKHLARLLRK